MRTPATFAAFALTVLAAAPLARAADWADIEGRIQYAFYTGDARALNQVVALLKPKPVDGESASDDEGAQRRYYSALAHYRLAQIHATGKKSLARDAIGDCSDEIDAAVDALPRVASGMDDSEAVRRERAELYTLGTACTLAGREMSSLPFGGGRIGSRIDEAVKLEPRNARVRFVEALASYERAGKDAAERAQAVQRLRASTEMFEAARQRASTLPEWGAAEAYAYLGRALLDAGDTLAAREALERALLIAPEYAFARRLMARITR